MTEIRLVVFDLVGTTVRDTGQVASSFAAALAAHGVSVTPEQIDGVRGSSKRDAVRSFVPEGPDRTREAERLYRSFRDHLSDRFSTEGVEPMPGAEPVFEWLRRRGVRVALNTGFDRDITGLLLAALRWDRGIVDAIVCGDDAREGRPAPDLIRRAMEVTGTFDARQVASVGDTVLDLEAGHRAGVQWNVGVLSGAHGRERLEQAPHTHILPSVAELATLWQVP